MNGTRTRGAEALASVGLEPVTLDAKEGLSLINGTQFMTAFASLGLVRARRLAKAADIACALSLEALQGSRTSFIPEIHALRPLPGQRDSAANVLRLRAAGAPVHRRGPQVTRQGHPVGDNRSTPCDRGQMDRRSCDPRHPVTGQRYAIPIGSIRAEALW